MLLICDLQAVAPAPSLDHLPTEILQEIISYVSSGGKLIPKHFQTLYAIAKVNRRFRALILAQLHAQISVPSLSRLERVLDNFKPHFPLIVALRVSHSHLFPVGTTFHEGVRFTHRRFPCALYLLPNLTVLDCLDFCFGPTQLSSVLGRLRSQIETVRVGWNGTQPFLFAQYPALTHLFIHVQKGEPRKISFPALNSTRSDCAPLKTLTVIDGLRWFERAVLERHRFSELTNLELFACAAHPTAIIGFIAEHPNLHAVSLDPIELSVPLALIVAASAFRRRELRLDLTTLQWEGPPLNLAPASTRLAVFNFANVDNLSFTRRGPLSAAVHDHDHGLQSLSLSFSALLNLSQLMALGAIPTILPQCGELNLKLLGTTLQTTEALLDRLGQSLSKWNHLTTLKLACILPDDWETSLELPLPVDHHGRPFPPTENSPTPMDTWYAATVQSAARYVRALAAQVTGLAVFEWSLRPDSFTRSSWGPLQPPLWRWDIIRDPDGSIRLLNEHLTWDGQINHPPYSRYH